MFKKFLSLALVVALIMSFAAIGVSAAEADVAATGDGLIYFDAASAGWTGASAISFYIYELGGSNVTEWGSKNKSLTDHDGDTWSFDATGAGVVDGKQYGIIFNNLDTTAQTADLLFDTSCIGDTAYVPNPDDKVENAVDSNKSSMLARWKSSSYGPIKQITSIGNIVGESIPSTTSAYQMMVNFLASKGSQGLTNALNFNGKDAQTTIDEVADSLGLTKSEVNDAISEAASTGDGTDTTDWTGKWDASKSSLAGEVGSADDGGDDDTAESKGDDDGTANDPDEDADDNTGTPSNDGNNNNTNNNNTNNNNSNSGNNNSNSGTKTTGSASDTQTGQEETVLFIMLGVMVAAAGVIFFARKRERA